MTAKRSFQLGDRVKIVSSHRWMPGRTGKVVGLQPGANNRFVVRFDIPELGFYREIIRVQTIKHGVVEKIGEPRMLSLTDIDLELLEAEDD